MSQAEALASHWVLLFFLGLLNKYMLAWSIDYAPVRLPSYRQDFVHRTWSEWTLWSACSRSCGGGVKMRTRVCRMRSYGGNVVPNACVGETIEYELCSVHNCSPFDIEFLEYQCSLRDGQSVGSREVEEWIPYRYGKNPCELQCWSKDRSLVHSFGKAIDGTKCATEDPRQPALCINGRCTPVDCAGQIGLDNKLDRCGVCRGNNSTCYHFQDIFWQRPRIKASVEGSKDHHYDYERITTIPAGATEIVVKENSETNFLALMDHEDHFQVNGNWRIQSPGRFLIHGSEFLYNRTWNGEESLSTLRPTRFDVHVYVLGSGDIPTVHYEYWISTNNPFKPMRSFLTLNQIKQADGHESKLASSKNVQPENNHIHDEYSTKKQVPPITKFQGYKSYYHRNEILKSVPSWSVKRHHTHKNDFNRQFHQHNNTSTTIRSDFVDVNPRFVPLDNRIVQSASGVENKLDAKAGLDKNKHKFVSRTYNFPERKEQIQTRNRSDMAVAKTVGFQRHSIDLSPNSHKIYDVKQRHTNVLSSQRKGLFENIEENVDDHGRPTTTLAQIKKANNNRETFIPLLPKYVEKGGNSNIKDERETRKRRPKEKQKLNKKRSKSPETGECLPCPKPKHQKKSFCTSDFVLRAIVLSIEKQEQSFRYELEISQSYKNKVPISPREYIWTADSCKCPKLRTGKEYIIMGYSGTSGNRRESRLLMNRHSFVRKYSLKRARTMLRLVRDQRTLCKNF